MYFSADKTNNQSTEATKVATSKYCSIPNRVTRLLCYMLDNSVQETINVNPATLPVPNPDSANFDETFQEYVRKLVETVNVHKHSATCYKYFKAQSDATKKCRMRMP